MPFHKLFGEKIEVAEAKTKYQYCTTCFSSENPLDFHVQHIPLLIEDLHRNTSFVKKNILPHLTCLIRQGKIRVRD